MKTIMLAAVRFYRNWISPVFPGSCRFEPTCSVYAQRALERYGAWRGALLTGSRLLKCHPFHPGGYDPVPNHKDNSKVHPLSLTPGEQLQRTRISNLHEAHITEEQL
jgi:putative membrane protein insertion efficiency factor